MGDQRHPFPDDPERLARCPAGCGRVVDFSLPLPECFDCGRRLCLNCAKLWPADDGNADWYLCKKDWRTRQVQRSMRGLTGN